MWGWECFLLRLIDKVGGVRFFDDLVKKCYHELELDLLKVRLLIIKRGP